MKTSSMPLGIAEGSVSGGPTAWVGFSFGGFSPVGFLFFWGEHKLEGRILLF